MDREFNSLKNCLSSFDIFGLYDIFYIKIFEKVVFAWGGRHDIKDMIHDRSIKIMSHTTFS